MLGGRRRVGVAAQTRAHSSGARGFVANFDRQRGPFDESARVCGGVQSRFVTRPEQFGVGTRCLPIHLNRVQIAALTSAVSCTRFEGGEAMCLGESHGLGRQRAVRGCG